MKCDQCRKEYRGQIGYLVKFNGTIIHHFCSDWCITNYYMDHEKFVQRVLEHASKMDGDPE